MPIAVNTNSSFAIILALQEKSQEFMIFFVSFLEFLLNICMYVRIYVSHKKTAYLICFCLCADILSQNLIGCHCMMKYISLAKFSPFLLCEQLKQAGNAVNMVGLGCLMSVGVIANQLSVLKQWLVRN
jgi:hypothetical protein